MIIPKIKLLSVVIPSRGRSGKLVNLLETLGKIQPSTRTPFEVVLVIDGDGDPPAINPAYPFRVICTSHIGAGPARNLGIKAASGDAILFLNDDVIPQSGFLDAHIEALDAGHDAVLGQSPWIETIDSQAFDGFIRYTPAIFDQHNLIDGQRYDFKHGWTLNLSVRKTALDTLDGPFHPELRPIYFEDIEFAYRCFADAPRIVYCESACAIHDHRVSMQEYFSREVLLGMMSVTLFEHNQACFDEIFPCSPTDHTRQVADVLTMDARDHLRLMTRFVQLATGPVDKEDPIGQAQLLYDLHLPLKRRAFRIGLQEMEHQSVPWEQRVERANCLMRHDSVFKVCEPARR